jgi:hypothetical protein
MRSLTESWRIESYAMPLVMIGATLMAIFALTFKMKPRW